MSYETAENFSAIKIPTNIKVVLLDFDNTCYLYDPCHESALSAVITWFEKNLGAIPDFTQKYQAAQSIIKGRIPNQAASHSRILYFKTLLENLKSKNSIENALKMEQVYWATFKQKMSPVPGLFEFLAQCQENDTKVVVVSDLTTTIQCEKIGHLGISSYIDVLVTSEETGVEKPNPECFKLALEKVGHTTSEALVIGDSYERDIVGALALNIRSLLITHENSTDKFSKR